MHTLFLSSYLQGPLLISLTLTSESSADPQHLSFLESCIGIACLAAIAFIILPRGFEWAYFYSARSQQKPAAQKGFKDEVSTKQEEEVATSNDNSTPSSPGNIITEEPSLTEEKQSTAQKSVPNIDPVSFSCHEDASLPMAIDALKNDESPRGVDTSNDEGYSFEAEQQQEKDDIWCEVYLPTPTKQEESEAEEILVKQGKEEEIEPFATVSEKEFSSNASTFKNIEEDGDICDDNDNVHSCEVKPGEKRSVLALISVGVIDRTQASNQKRALALLQARKVPYETVDGMDPSERGIREGLFSLAGLETICYPQFFFVGHGTISYLGDYERLESLNEALDIPQHCLDDHPEIETWERVFQDVVDPSEICGTTSTSSTE